MELVNLDSMMSFVTIAEGASSSLLPYLSYAHTHTHTHTVA